MGNCGEKSIILYILSFPMRFTGTIQGKLDAKGRVFFPAAFRKKLADGEEDFVLRRDIFQPCLTIYPLSVWEAEVSQLRERINRWDPKQAMVLRQFMADAEILSLDASGRFLFSKRMLQIAEIDKEIVFIGMDDRIEVWSKEHTDTPFLSADEFSSALQEIMSSKDPLNINPQNN